MGVPFTHSLNFNVKLNFQDMLEDIQLAELKLGIMADIIPPGWRNIPMRKGKTHSNYILSPEGKRFDNLEEAYEFFVDKKLKEDKVSRRENMLKQLFEAEETPLALSESAKFKRKYMAEKSPWRNLLKRTLEKNHAKNVTKSLRTNVYHKFLVKRKRILRRVSRGL